MEVGQHRRMSRDEALLLVRRLLGDDAAGESEGAKILEALQRELGCPT